MRDLDVRRMRSRVKGRAALKRSLRGLHLRIHRFGELRAQPGSADYQWALHVSSALEALIREGGGGRIERRP